MSELRATTVTDTKMDNEMAQAADISVIICAYTMPNRRRREVETNKRRKRTILLTVGVLLIVYFSITLVLGENGFLRYLQLKDVKSGIQNEIEGIKIRNEEMKRQRDAAKKDSTQMEELARKHGLTMDGEVIFKFEEKQ